MAGAASDAIEKATDGAPESDFAGQPVQPVSRALQGRYVPTRN